MVGRKRDGSEPAQVRHSRGRGAGGVECRGERLVRLGSCGGRFSVCVRVRTRVGLQPHTPRNRKYYEELDQRDIGTKSKKIGIPIGKQRLSQRSGPMPTLVATP